MNKPILSIKNKNKPLISISSSSPGSVISSTVVARNRKQEISVADLRKPPSITPILQAPKGPPPVSKSNKKPKSIKPVPVPVVPREERMAACLADLQTTWPKLFDEAKVILWEVGIHRKFWRGLNKKHSRTLISHTLELWQKQHPEYQELLKTAGNPRYGLDGTVTMVVTETQAQHAVDPIESTKEDLTERFVITQGFP